MSPCLGAKQSQIRLRVTYFDVRMGFQDFYVVEKVDTYIALNGDHLEMLEDFSLTFL